MKVRYSYMHDWKPGVNKDMKKCSIFVEFRD